MFSRVAATLLLLFYGAGMFLLPGGDFRSLRYLPDLYQHCKANEDKDMTLVDFITDHLTCLDALTDVHAPGDEQRPHTPPTGSRSDAPLWLTFALERPLVPAATVTDRLFVEKDQRYTFEFHVPVFRPPLA